MADRAARFASWRYLFPLLAFAALAAALSIPAQAHPASPPSLSLDWPSIDCAQAKARGLDRQTNPYAEEVVRRCWGAIDAPPPAAGASQRGGKVAAPHDYGGPDVNLITGPEEPPYNWQVGSYVWGIGSTVVVAYLDVSNPGTARAGLSYSTDGGATFTRVLPSPFSSGHGNVYGNPMVVYNAHLARWYAAAMAQDCGGSGLGLWTSPDGISWSAGACARNSDNDDHFSMWVDNNPVSTYYGRMYITWNNFVSGGAPQISYSDNGTTWSEPVNITTIFLRNVNVVGSPDGDGYVYVALMQENGGMGNPRNPMLYRSSNGGASWEGHAMGGAFAAPGSAAICGGYFYGIAQGWREMGWGQLGAGPGGALHYAYTAHGAGSDTGDIFYIRSTDRGSSWSTPMRLNTDTTTREQWNPSLSVTGQGALIVGWYDRRDTTGNDYRYWGRASTDGGITWQPDEPVSDAVSPDPSQSGCITNYHRHSAGASTSYLTWTDGRNVVGGTPDPDIYFDREPFVQATATATVTNTRTPSPTPCPIFFTDVHPSDYFYNAVRFIYCRGVISGYGDNTFRPYFSTTRGQMCKMIVLMYDLAIYTPPTPSFSDVATTHTFYQYIETAVHNNIVSGYADGTFRPQNNVTRAQTAKMVVLAAQWPLIHYLLPTFNDVPKWHPFYTYIETAACHGAMTGYRDGTFRPYNSATRGQIAKVIYEAVAGGWPCP